MTLIAIKSCQRDREQGFHQAIRETWAANMPFGINLRFFMGGDVEHSVGDETWLACPDDYRSLPLKTKAIAGWCVSRDVSKVFLCDNDTYINLPEFLPYTKEDVDYAGRFSFWPKDAQIGTTFRYDDGQGNIHDPCHAWASGGFGYFLSAKVLPLVANMTPVSWAEDLSVGQVLGPLVQGGQIKAKNFEYSNRCVWHIHKSPKLPFTPQRIRDYHNGVRP